MRVQDNKTNCITRRGGGGAGRGRWTVVAAPQFTHGPARRTRVHDRDSTWSERQRFDRLMPYQVLVLLRDGAAAQRAATGLVGGTSINHAPSIISGSGMRWRKVKARAAATVTTPAAHLEMGVGGQREIAAEARARRPKFCPRAAPRSRPRTTINPPGVLRLEHLVAVPGNTLRYAARPLPDNPGGGKDQPRISAHNL